MKTIIYKKRGKSYECTSVKDSTTPISKLIFEEAFDGKVKISNLIISIENGVGEFDASVLESGEYAPLLIRGGEIIRMESLIIDGGKVSRKSVSEDFVRELSARIEENSRLISELEEIVHELSLKIISTIDLY